MNNKFQINQVVGFIGYLNHCYGRIILGKQIEPGKWKYLIDESPHNISEETESFLVANAKIYGKEGNPIEPGYAHSCGWWNEEDLKERKPNTICRCKYCKKYKNT